MSLQVPSKHLGQIPDVDEESAYYGGGSRGISPALSVRSSLKKVKKKYTNVLTFTSK